MNFGSRRALASRTDKHIQAPAHAHRTPAHAPAYALHPPCAVHAHARRAPSHAAMCHVVSVGPTRSRHAAEMHPPMHPCEAEVQRAGQGRLGGSRRNVTLLEPYTGSCLGSDETAFIQQRLGGSRGSCPSPTRTCFRQTEDAAASIDSQVC